MNYKFEDINSWTTLSCKQGEIFVDAYGRVERVKTKRGKVLMSDKAVKWVLDKDLDVNVAFWRAKRDEAFEAWKKSAEHYSFYSDGGTLAVRVNRKAVLRIGCGGDGRHRLYIVQNGEKFPPLFRFTGISLDGCKIEPLAYDCGGTEALCAYEMKSVWFYRHDGDILIAEV